MMAEMLAGQQRIEGRLDAVESAQRDRELVEEKAQAASRSTPGLVQGVAAPGRTPRAREVLARAALANSSKLALDGAAQAKLEELLLGVDDEDENLVRQDNTHTQHRQASDHNTFRSELMPLKSSEKQDLASLLAEAVTVKSRTIKKFKDVEHLLYEMEQQLATFINEDGAYSARVRSFLRYTHELIQMAVERGMEAVNFYHWKLFERIGDDRHDPSVLGYQAIDLLLRVHSKYPSITENKQKNGAYKKVQRGKAGGSGSNINGASGTYPAGSCPKHPQSTTHTAAQCRANNPNAPRSAN